MSVGSQVAQTKFAYAFTDPHEPGIELPQLLGNKGAGLHEMACRLGLPVPAGFTITVEACRAFRRSGWLAQFDDAVDEQLVALEQRTERRLGSTSRPLLVSVRSGAVVSMPGMMDTILNVGLCDATLDALANETGDERFALDCYRRLIAMFGHTVLDVPRASFEEVLDATCRKAGVSADADLSPDALREVSDSFLRIVESTTGSPFPQDPRVQLTMAIAAVFRSWDSPRAVDFRRIEHIEGAEGTAVTVQTMVFGNRGPLSGTGVAFSRDPISGAPGLTGDWLDRAHGEDVVARTRTTRPLTDLAESLPEAYALLDDAAQLCERHARDLVDIEFTVDDGTFWMLQSRVGRRSAVATVRIAVDLAREGVISAAEAVARVKPEALEQVLTEAAARSDREPVARGLAASAGVAVGRVYFSADDALDAADRGETVLLVRPETSPDDIAGIDAAAGILTSRGGLVSHAAVVARSWGKPAVVGVASLIIEGRSCTIGPHVVAEGDVVSIDGASGDVFLGAVSEAAATVPAEVEQLLQLADAVRGSSDATDARARLGLAQAFLTRRAASESAAENVNKGDGYGS